MAPTVRRPLLLAIVCFFALASSAATADTRYAVKGLVLEVARDRASFVVSHDAIPGVMAAMAMPIDVRRASELEGVGPGTMVEFTLVVGDQTSHAEGVRIRRYESAEQDPLAARRLKLFQQSQDRARATAVSAGHAVPDFTLTDQRRRQVALSQFKGKVVAVNFIYTHCVLPQFCYRTANQFNVVHRRFKERSDLVLLTITFDPVRDTPEALAEYARQWNASADAWRFLTGSVADIRRVTSLFGVDYFPEEGLMSHSLHTAVIDRQGRLVANVEGNQFTAAQLGDLVQTALDARP